LQIAKSKVVAVEQRCMN